METLKPDDKIRTLRPRKLHTKEKSIRRSKKFRQKTIPSNFFEIDSKERANSITTPAGSVAFIPEAFRKKFQINEELSYAASEKRLISLLQVLATCLVLLASAFIMIVLRLFNKYRVSIIA